MRRRTAALALGTAAAMVLTGCSTMSPGESGTVTLNMVESLTNPARTDLLEELIADFEKQNPKIKVKLVSPPTEQADQKLQQMLQSGSGVDVLEVRDITVGPWANNGWLYDMKKDLAGWKGWEALTDNAVAASEDDKGRTHFVPYGFYGLSLFHRTDLIEEAGFDNPRPPGTSCWNRRRRSTTRRRAGTATPSAAAPTRTATPQPPSRRTSPTGSTRPTAIC